MSFEVGDLIIPKQYANKMNSSRAKERALKVVKVDNIFKIEDFETYINNIVYTDELHKMMRKNDISNEDIIEYLNKNYICVEIKPSNIPFYVSKHEFTKFTGDASGLKGGSPKRNTAKKNKTARRTRIKNSPQVRLNMEARGLTRNQLWLGRVGYGLYGQFRGDPYKTGVSGGRRQTRKR